MGVGRGKSGGVSVDARCCGVLGSSQGSLRGAGLVEMGRVQAWVVVVAALAMDAAAKVLWVETDLRAECMLV